jgi:hypothetical protein
LSFDDYRLNAQVRQVLVRMGVELTKTEHGVTNSVIYVRGTVRSYLDRDSSDPAESRHNQAALATRLERMLRRLPGVRDVVFNIDNLTKVGRRWKFR